MEENPRSTRNMNHRWSTAAVDEVAGDDLIKCSGKHCRSCAAGLIADCVAVCCCPCAVVSFLVLALVKAPWMICRKCLGLGKNRVRRPERKRKICEGRRSPVSDDCMADTDGISGIWRVEEGRSESVFALGDEERKDNLSARFEAERIWLELHQLGHLGFGRVSFSGIVSGQG